MECPEIKKITSFFLKVIISRTCLTEKVQLYMIPDNIMEFSITHFFSMICISIYVTSGTVQYYKEATECPEIKKITSFFLKVIK
jgi:hypothetical protein